MTTDGDETTPPKRRGGRPPSRKRGTFAFRVTAELREKLEAAATASGRPISEEIESRLEASFREIELINKVSEQTKVAFYDELIKIDNEKYGGRSGREAAVIFGNIFSQRLKEAENIFGYDEKWFMNDAKVIYLKSSLHHIGAIVVDRIVSECKHLNRPVEVIAVELRIPVEGLTREQVQAKIAEHFMRQSGRLK